MPIWLRNFTFNKLKAHFDNEAEAYEKSNKTSKSESTQVARPNIKPAYTTKGSNK